MNNIGQIVIYFVMAAAVIALMFVAIRQFGLTIPPWVIQVFWIVVVAVVVIFAIQLIIGPFPLGLR